MDMQTAGQCAISMAKECIIWRRQGIVSNNTVGYVPKDCEGLFILSTSLHYIKCAGDTQGRSSANYHYKSRLVMFESEADES